MAKSALRLLRDPLKYRAVILDTIHKFIQINNLEYFLLQTPFLNRLHRIKQLGFTYLIFPSAKHSRFEHSLGVMHLAGRIAERLLRKSNDLILKRKSQRAEKYFIEIARLAGLLHDLGHYPYSHNMEEPLHDAYRNPVKYNLDVRRIESLDLSKKKLHEVATITFIDKIIEIIEESGHSSELLLSAREALDGKESCNLLNDLGIEEYSLDIISQIISHKVVDADRLDYLIRDAHATGVLFGYIDIERLIDSLYLKKEDDKVILSLDPKGIPAVEDAYDARFKMYRSVYYHHKNIALTLALTKLLPYLFKEWKELSEKIYGECLTYPEKLFDLREIAECVARSEILLTDTELESILLMASKSKGVLGRWAKPLLFRRDLIPISLIKRPDVLVSKVLSQLESYTNNLSLTSKVISNAFRKVYPYITEHLQAKIRSYMKIDDVFLEAQMRQIIDEPDERILLGGYPSVYFENLIESGRIPFLYAYVYSEDPNTHEKLRRKAGELRKITENTIVLSIKEIVLNELKR